jgi:hypothetical protein
VTPTTWHTAAAARNRIAAIDPAQAFVTAHIALVGNDRLIWNSPADEALEHLRTVAVERAAGYRFTDASTREQRLAYMAHDEAAPTVPTVLAMRFGDPAALFGPVRSVHEAGETARAANVKWRAMCAVPVQVAA